MSASHDRLLSELYADQAARLYAYARRHGDPATAEDLVAVAAAVVAAVVVVPPVLESGDATAADVLATFPGAAG